MSSMRQVGLRLNIQLEKYLFVLTPVSLILGFLLSEQSKGGVALVPYLFAFLTFVMATGCSWRQIKGALAMPGMIVLTFAITHIVAPAIAYAAGAAFFGADSPYVIGLVLLAIIPLGVSSVIWVSISKGHVPFTLAMIVIDTAISPFVIPAAMKLIFAEAIELDLAKVMADLLQIVVVPTVLGVIVNELSQQRFKDWSAPAFGPLSKVALCSVILINSAAIAEYVIELKHNMLTVVPLVAVLVFIFYLIGFVSSIGLRRPELMIAMTYSSGMRNISLGIVLGLAYFSPIAAIPVVIGILIQQPFATLNHAFLKRLMQTKLYKKITGIPAPEELR
ncbi:bile acid:sodium symporter family protein [Paenibacillus sp. YYML68]|uniref:bile acid:sodium symporter family protein n=1 Tax=Paenibacillus sp. YYML68 TaxID=2909250 RepID=UPI0024921E10|nr:bile acid:sodium symporter family protein [Paenibacillus sp. YYML68]